MGKGPPSPRPGLIHVLFRPSGERGPPAKIVKMSGKRDRVEEKVGDRRRLAINYHVKRKIFPGVRLYFVQRCEKYSVQYVKVLNIRRRYSLPGEGCVCRDRPVVVSQPLAWSIPPKC